MDITNRKLMRAREAFDRLQEAKPKMSLAQKIARIVRKLQPEYDTLDKLRGELMEKFAAKDEEGNLVPGEEPGTVKLDDADGFSEEWRTLMEQTISVEITNPIPAHKINFPMSIGDLAALIEIGVISDEDTADE